MTDESVARYVDLKKPRFLKRDVMIYSYYERFWHWSQALLIFALFFSGLGLHGTHGLLDFRTAVTVHSFSAIALIVLWIFTTFWNFTTGQWKQYLFKKGIWPVDVAVAALFLIEGATTMTGECIRMDCGQHLADEGARI